MEVKLFNRIHTSLFEEILKGKFKPFLPKYNDNKALQSLFADAQTLKIQFNTDISQKYMDEVPDMREHGFKRPEHFTYTIHEGKKTDTWELTIIPLNLYKLRENIQIPIYPSAKAKEYCRLICDEFERIKIRAEYVLEMVESKPRLNLYATKNITKAKKLHHDARILLSKLQQEANTESVFIIFVLDLFIIQTILLYQKLFKSYLEGITESEHELKTELFTLAFSGHAGFITGMWDEKKSQPVSSWFQHDASENSLLPTGKKSSGEYQGVPEDSTRSDYKSIVEKSSSSVSEINEPNSPEYGTSSEKTFSKLPENHTKYKWNGQINVLVDIFAQITNKILPDGLPLLSMSCTELQDFLQQNFTDKHGHKLSSHTLRTILNPHRTDKKIHPDSPKRVDLSGTI